MRRGRWRFGRLYCRPNPRICMQEGLPTFSCPAHIVLSRRGCARVADMLDSGVPADDGYGCGGYAGSRRASRGCCRRLVRGGPAANGMWASCDRAGSDRTLVLALAAWLPPRSLPRGTLKILLCFPSSKESRTERTRSFPRQFQLNHAIRPWHWGSIMVDARKGRCSGECRDEQRRVLWLKGKGHLAWLLRLRQSLPRWRWLAVALRMRIRAAAKLLPLSRCPRRRLSI